MEFQTWAPEVLVSRYQREPHPALGTLISDSALSEFWRKVSMQLGESTAKFPDGIPTSDGQLIVRKLIAESDPIVAYWCAIRRAMNFEPMSHTKSERLKHLESIKNKAEGLLFEIFDSEYFTNHRFREMAKVVRSSVHLLEPKQAQTAKLYEEVAEDLTHITLDGVLTHLRAMLIYAEWLATAPPVAARQKNTEMARLVKFCRQMVEYHRNHLFGPSSPRHDLIAELATALKLVPEDYEIQSGFGMQEVQNMTRGL